MMSKKLGIVLLVMLALVVTTGTFAYWASGVSGNNTSGEGTITVGSGETVTTTVNLSAATIGTGNLVPAGKAGTGEVETIDIQFDVDWDSTGQDASGLTGDLAVSVDSVLNTSSADVSSLFNVAGLTGYTLTTDGAAQTVTLTITMNEPANQTEYDSVATEDVTFTFTFTVTPQ